MAKKSIQEQIADAEHQMEIWSNREKRLANREKYLRIAKDRKRTHRLIQYGVAFECNHKELEVLTDVEVYELVESLMNIPEVVSRIQAAVERHSTAEEGGS